MKPIQSIRGMNDIMPAESRDWRHFEETARGLLEGYGYREIRPPIVERTELFARSIGEVTDIVEKEMYTFEDRNGDHLALRPECTASCVRAGLEHGLLHNQVQRLWYLGPMFRHERPQKGRYRQFYQVGAEAFGLAGPGIDAEMILLNARLWRRLGLAGILRLELNTLGSRAARDAYRERLVAFLEDHRDELDEDGRRRLETNPLRILDSKNPALQPVLDRAPRMLEHLDPESAAHFDALQRILSEAGVDFVINPRLVRGLDYYTRTVFEWTTDRLGAQGTVSGGGRYDGLVEQIGGRPTPGVGFSMGIERIIELMRAQGTRAPEVALDAYLVAVGEDARAAAHPLAERLRDRLEDLTMVVDAGAGGFKAKLKRADRSAAKLALILGEEELRERRIGIKHLREPRPQTSVSLAELGPALDRLRRGREAEPGGRDWDER